MEKSQIKNIFILLLILSFGGINAQNITSKSIETSFAQTQINFNHETGELSNILKIKNFSNTPVEVKLEVFMPDGWSLIFAMPEKLTLKPNGKTTYFTLDIAVPDEALGGTIHQMFVRVLTLEEKTIDSAVCGVMIPEVRGWNVWSEKNEIFVPAKTKMVPVKLLLKNTGNLEETFHIKFQQHPNLIITRGIRKKLKLMPGQDTALIYEAHYLPAAKPIQQLSIRFEVGHEVSEKIQKGYLTFLFLESEFDNFDTKNKNVSTEIFAGNMSADNQLNMGLRTEGTVAVGSKQEVDFSVESRNLLNPTIENTQYAVKYEGEKLKLESQNGIAKATYRNEKNTFEKWSVGATQNFRSGVTQLEYKQQKLLVDTRMSGGLNFYNDARNARQMSIANLAVDMPVFQKSRLYLSLQDVLVNDAGSETSYKSNAFRYFLRYEGNHSLTWRTLFQSSYASAHHPFGLRNVFQAQGQVSFQSLNQKHHAVANGSTAKKRPKAYEKGRLLAPQTYDRNRLSLNYTFVFLPQMSVELGGMFEQFNSERFSSLTSEKLPFQKQTTELSLTTSFKKYFWMNIKHKQHNVSDFVSSTHLYKYENLPTFESTTIRARLQKDALTFNYHFQKMDDYANYLGDTTSQNLNFHMGQSFDLTYQTRWARASVKYFLENGKNRLIVPVHFQGRLFRRSIKWKISANAVHLFGAQTTTFFTRAALDWHFGKGWHLLAKGQFYQKNQTLQTENSETVQTQNTKVEIGVKKDFHFDPMSGKIHDIAIQCYKDENGNGKFDEGEAPMSDVRLHLTPVKDSLFLKTNFREAAIFSAGDGHAQFKNLPRGAYQLSVHQLFPDNDGYFNTTSESRRIDLIDNQDLKLSFGKGKAIEGKLTLKRDDNSSYDNLPLKGIRITATSPTGRTFSALTNKKGNFTLFVPYSDYYIVQTKNPYGEDFELMKGSEKVIFKEEELPFVEFVIEEATVEIEWN